MLPVTKRLRRRPNPDLILPSGWINFMQFERHFGQTGLQSEQDYLENLSDALA